MTAATRPAQPDRPTARPQSVLRSVAMPTEHGGWSLTLEPVLLGLIVAWSWSGLALGTAAMLAFVARTPLKIVLVDRWRRRRLDRTRVAAQVAAVEVGALGALVVLAAVGAERSVWPPFAVAAPLVALEMWFDMRSRSRRLLPELAGSVGIGSVATAIALADGADTSMAVGLWCVVAARALAAIPYVRTQVLRLHGRPHHRWQSDLAQAAGLAAVAVGWALDAVPLASIVAIGFVALVNLTGVRLAPRPAKVLGMQQMVLGLAVTAVTAVAVLA